MPNNASQYLVEDDFDINARPNTDADSPVIEGWGISSANDSKGDFPVDFKFTGKIQVVKFHPDSFPPISYKQHFLSTKSSGKKSYTCLNPKGAPSNPCPLCQMDSDIAGQRAELKAAFTVVNFSAQPFERQLLTASKRLIDTLHTVDSSEIGPLEGKYWTINRSGERQTTAYHLNAVKERDLQEDWGIDPKAAKEFFDSIDAWPKTTIKYHTYAELLEIAQSLS
jgi:hypothetical protein